MATIDEVRHGIQVLVENIAASEAQLEELKRQKNEDGRSNEAKKDIGDEIAFIRSNILEDKRRLTAMEQQIAEDKRKEAGQGCLDAMFLVLKQSTSNSHAIPSVVPPHLLFDCHSVAIRNARIWKLSTENGLFISSMIPGTLMPASFVPCGRAFIPWRLLP
jgi:hypothetical protein